MRFHFKDLVLQRLGDGSVKALSNIQVNVYYEGTTTRPVLYAGGTGGTTKSNPFLTTLGDVDFWIDDEGNYEIVFHDTQPVARISDTTVNWRPALPSQPGDIKMFHVNTAQPGYLLCNGAAVSRTTYADLFAKIGTTFGSGNGSTTFNVPDLAGRSPIGAGSGSGLTTRAVGDKVGTENHVLTTAQLPSHEHDNAHRHRLFGVEVLAGSGGTTIIAPARGTTGNTYRDNVADVQDSGSVAQPFVENTSDTTSAAGGGNSHPNMQPSTALSFQIRHRK